MRPFIIFFNIFHLYVTDKTDLTNQKFISFKDTLYQVEMRNVQNPIGMYKIPDIFTNNLLDLIQF